MTDEADPCDLVRRREWCVDRKYRRQQQHPPVGQPSEVSRFLRLDR